MIKRDKHARNHTRPATTPPNRHPAPAPPPHPRGYLPHQTRRAAHPMFPIGTRPRKRQTVPGCCLLRRGGSAGRRGVGVPPGLRPAFRLGAARQKKE